MPTSAAAKRLILLSGVVLLALLIAGFITGAIGNAFFGDEGSKPFVKETDIVTKLI